MGPMAITDLDPIDRELRQPVRRRARLSSWEDRIPTGLAVTVGAMWVAAIPLSIAIEPAPDDPDVALPWYGALLVYAFLSSLLLAAAGLFARQRAGLVASLVAGSVFLVNAVACPVSGHHVYGTWWLGQLAIGLALVAVSAVAFVGTARPKST